MPTMTKGKVTVKSNLKTLKTALRENVLDSLRGAAFDGRAMARREINKPAGARNPHKGTRTVSEPGMRGWADGLNADTGALSKSLYVFAPRFNDYDKALREATAAYLTRYPQTHLSRRTLPKIEAPQLGAEVGVMSAQAGFSTCLLYGLWWERGHDNKWTRRHEQQAFMGPNRDYALERLLVRLKSKNLFVARKR